MKRRVLLTLLLLVGGAIVNVAVAWGCALWSGSNIPRDRVHIRLPDQREVAWFLSRLPELGYLMGDVGDAMDQDVHYSSHAFGLDSRLVSLAQGCVVASTNAGWPMRSWGAEHWVTEGVVSNSGVFHADWLPYRKDHTWQRLYGRFLPLVPIWPGFAINTVFYAALLWLLFAGPFVLRRRRRIRGGLCPKCAYDLRGAPAGATACPECGTPVNRIAR